ncbi:MAG: hypothetical protein M1822_007065 [Bathelium mastoideum]|nr:MAG: hypothetical protein M1822_007065 [Bathelium mastoideum]
MSIKTGHALGAIPPSTTVTEKFGSRKPSSVTQQEQRKYDQKMEFDHLGPVNDPLVSRDPFLLREDAALFYDGALEGQPEEQAACLSRVVTKAMFIRGAILAQDPNGLDPQEDSDSFRPASSPVEPDSTLDDVEFKALETEKKARFRDQTKPLNLILLTCCVGAVVQGWSQTSMTGANLTWPCEFPGEIGVVDAGICKTQRKWIFNAINAAIYFSASTVGVWVSDFLNDKLFGRRGALMTAGTCTFVASVWSGYCRTWPELLVARLLLGVGYGAKASVVTIFEAEVSPGARRGRLLVSWQFFTAVGIFLGASANLIFYDNWRLQISSSYIPSITFITLAWACSESPRWLIKKERYREAFKVLRDLRGTDLQAARDLYYIYAQLRVEMSIFAGETNTRQRLVNWRVYWTYSLQLARSSYFLRVRQLFSIRRNRRAALASSVVMASQQLTGINIFAFLVASLLTAAGSRPIVSLWSSFAWAGCNAIFSTIAYWHIDTKGRRFLLLTSLILMVPLVMGQGLSLAISTSGKENSVHTGIVILLIILNTAAYSPGAGVVPFLYSSEVFPLINREAGMSWSCFVNFALGSIVLFFVPLSWTSQPVASIKSSNTTLFFIFTGLDFLAAILVWFLVPETNHPEKAALEEMNYLFSIPTSAAVKYHTLQAVDLRKSIRPNAESAQEKLPATLRMWWDLTRSEQDAV